MGSLNSSITGGGDMEDKPSNWLFKAVLIGIGWLLLEVLAGLIHVAMMKKASLCPYMEDKKKRM